MNEKITEEEMEQVLEDLTKQGQVEVMVIDGKRHYRLTEAGVRYVERELLPRLGIEVLQ